MKAPGLALGAGALFGVGLGLSGMTQPPKVIAFLDVTGRWDPSLMFVMMGAIPVYFALQRLIRRRATPIYDAQFHWPDRKTVDRSLLLGSALFGVGWGLGGFCPGPAIVSTGAGGIAAFTFVGAMALGMLLHAATRSRAQ
jgi:uncharacterized membrane protein YedE/YeeE